MRLSYCRTDKVIQSYCRTDEVMPYMTDKVCTDIIYVHVYSKLYRGTWPVYSCPPCSKVWKPVQSQYTCGISFTVSG